MSKPPHLEYAISSSLGSSVVSAGQDGGVTLIIQNKNVTATTRIDHITVKFLPNPPLWESEDALIAKVAVGNGWQVKNKTIIPPGSIPVGDSAQIEWRGNIDAKPGICTVRMTQFPGEYSVDQKIYKSSQNSGLGQLISNARYVDYGQPLSFNWGPIYLSQNYKLISLRLLMAVKGREEYISPKTWDSFPPETKNYPMRYPEDPRIFYEVKELGSPLNYLLIAQVQENISTGTRDYIWYASCSVELNKIPHILDFRVFPNEIMLGNTTTPVKITWEVMPDVKLCNLTDQDSQSIVSDIKLDSNYQCSYTYFPQKSTNFIVVLVYDDGTDARIHPEALYSNAKVQAYQRKLNLIKNVNNYKKIINLWWEYLMCAESVVFLSDSGIIEPKGSRLLMNLSPIPFTYHYFLPIAFNDSGNKFFYAMLVTNIENGNYLGFCSADYSRSLIFPAPYSLNLIGQWGIRFEPLPISLVCSYTDLAHPKYLYIIRPQEIWSVDISALAAAGGVVQSLTNCGSFQQIVSCCSLPNDRLCIVYNGGDDFFICNTLSNPWSRSTFNFKAKFNINEKIVNSECLPCSHMVYFSGASYIYVMSVPNFQIPDDLILQEKIAIPFQIPQGKLSFNGNALYLLDDNSNFYSISLNDSQPYSQDTNKERVGGIDHKYDDSKYNAASNEVTVIGKPELKSQPQIVYRRTSVNPHYYFSLVNGLRTSVNFGLLGSSAVGLLDKATALSSVAIVESSYLALTTAGVIVQSKWIKPVEDRPELTWKQGLILLVVAAAGAALLWSDFNNSGAGRRSQIGILLVAFSAFLTNLILNFSNKDFTDCNKRLPPPTPAHKDHGVVIEIPPIRKEDEIEEAHFLTSPTEKERKYSISVNTPYTMIHESQPLLKKREAAKNFNPSNLSP